MTRILISGVVALAITAGLAFAETKTAETVKDGNAHAKPAIMAIDNKSTASSFNSLSKDHKTTGNDDQIAPYTKGMAHPPLGGYALPGNEKPGFGIR